MKQVEREKKKGDDASDVFVSAVRQEVKWPFLSMCRFEKKCEAM